jgi:hypothetical protein
LTEQERSRILALVKQTPPEHLETQADGSMVARDEAAKAAGIQVKRSQTRHIYRREGVRWQHTHSWATVQIRILSAIDSSGDRVSW